MMVAGRRQLAAYIVGDGPRDNGDEDMVCPLHDDHRRSATVNFREGIWNCHAGCGGGRIIDLLAARPEWLPPPEEGAVNSAPNRPSTDSPGTRGSLPTPARLAGYNDRLNADGEALDYLLDQRGLVLETVQRYGLGWNGRKYVVPIYDDGGQLMNVRYYQPDGKPKWVNERGYGSPARLFPMDVIAAHDKLYWLEGEFDMMLTNQKGIPAFTATGGAKIVWQEEWDDILRGKHIVTCFDCDKDGQRAHVRVKPRLSRVAASVSRCKLPYPVTAKHGKDISDFWLDGHSPERLSTYIETDEVAPTRYQPVSYDSLHREKMKNRPVSVEGTVASIEGPFLMMPLEAHITCGADWKPTHCAVCPVGKRHGDATFKFDPEDEINLNLLEIDKRRQIAGVIADHCGVPHGCPKSQVDWSSRTAWHGEIRNGSNLSADAIPILAFTADAPNMGETIELQGQAKIGRRQSSIFVASSIAKVDTELDTFQLSPAQVFGIREIFNELPVADSKDPRQQLDKIAELTETHITRRFGQRWLHICTDLVYHSVIQFPFHGELLDRGWLEALVVGETRSGKSSLLKAYQSWYQHGEIVPCEKVSIPGLIATTEKRAGRSGDNWVSRVGKFPLCDRKLIVLDEAQGIPIEQIGQLSDARSSGIIKVTQASALTTTARVRLIWLANPRADSQTGVSALEGLMGKTEDLARVDLPLYVVQEMSAEDHARWTEEPPAIEDNPLKQALMQALLDWAWSRKPEDIDWAEGTVKVINRIADHMAEKYQSRIPLMPRNEARVRVARLAVAIAARLFSSDKEGRTVKVLPKHVRAAGWVYANLLKHPDLEYLVETRDAELEANAAATKAHELLLVCKQTTGLSAMLRHSFITLRQVQQVLGSESNYVMKKLSDMHAIRMTPEGYIINSWARHQAQESIK